MVPTSRVAPQVSRPGPSSSSPPWNVSGDCPHQKVSRPAEHTQLRHRSASVRTPPDVHHGIHPGRDLRVQGLPPSPAASARASNRAGTSAAEFACNVPAAAFMARVQGGEQVNHFGATDFPDHEPVRAHPKRLRTRSRIDTAPAPRHWEAGTRPDHVGMHRLEFAGVLDDQHPLTGIGTRRQAVRGGLYDSQVMTLKLPVDNESCRRRRSGTLCPR